MNLLQSPGSHQPLIFVKELGCYSTPDGKNKYPIKENVVCFLQDTDQFYEGAYMNRVRFIPKNETWWHRLPLWFINGGYMYEVRKQFKAGSILLELGCASGVDYFGKKFKMIGLDLSWKSLKKIQGYQLALQADATNIPLADSSVDGIISSYFWEHIPSQVKNSMLHEFQRILKPNGKLVFLYDVETDNGLINLLKKKDLALYNRFFLEGDGHLGYENPEANRIQFQENGFTVIKHFGMERTAWQSNSVYEKFRHLSGFPGFLGRLGYTLSKGKILGYLFSGLLRCWDETIGRLWPLNNSRIIITVARKQ